MDSLPILVNSLWAGLFASGMGLLLTAPLRYIAGTFLCGFAGRFALDVFMGWGLTQEWSTVVAAAVVVFVTAAIIRGQVVSPVILVTGVLPLGAAVAMFNAIADLMKVSSRKGEALSTASVALSANVGKVFTTSLAIALGLALGIAVVRLLRHESISEGF